MPDWLLTIRSMEIQNTISTVNIVVGMKINIVQVITERTDSNSKDLG